MAAEDEVVYRGWVTYKLRDGRTATDYFGPYSSEATAKGVVSNKIRAWRLREIVGRGVQSARFNWKDVDDSSGEA